MSRNWEKERVKKETSSHKRFERYSQETITHLLLQVKLGRGLNDLEKEYGLHRQVMKLWCDRIGLKSSYRTPKYVGKRVVNWKEIKKIVLG